MEIRVVHRLPPDEVARRVRGAAQRHELVVPDGAPGGELDGELEKRTPLGCVRARWLSAQGELVVTVIARPAFLPEETVRRALEQGLRALVS